MAHTRCGHNPRPTPRFRARGEVESGKDDTTRLTIAVLIGPAWHCLKPRVQGRQSERSVYVQNSDLLNVKKKIDENYKGRGGVQK